MANIAIQLYTLRSLTAADMAGTLSDLAGYGYKAVELAGYGNASPTEVAATLQEVGISAIAAHVSIDRLENEIDVVFEEMRTISCPDIVAPWLQPERRAPELAPQLAASLDAIGARCNDAGFRFSYHNHDFEFAPMAGSNLLDFLQENTDPVNVNFELDLYWAEYAGVDSVDLLKQFAGRAPLVHIKEMAAGEGREDAIVGEGILNWAAILPAAKAAGAEWYIIEQDNPIDARQSAIKSFSALKQLLA